MSEPAPVQQTDEESSDRTEEDIHRDTPEGVSHGASPDPDVTTGAESVVAALRTAGVELLFGVTGGAILPVYDALYEHDQITHITMAHEQGAVHAADAYGIVTGEPGVCMATSGPGATNLVTGIADASMDSDPLVALTGQVPTGFVGNDAFQETDTVGITQPVTKHSSFADDESTVGAEVGTAWALADAGRQGPTLVDLPKDVTRASTDERPGEPETPDTYDPPTTAEPVMVEAAAETLATARRPLVLAGGGVIAGEATTELRRLAREYGLPVVTTMPGTGAFPQTDPLSQGIAGMHGTGYANMAVSNCDAMLAVGTRFDDRLTGDIETFAPDAEIVHVDIDPAEISKNVEADYPLVGDAGVVLDQLHRAIPGRPPAVEWRDRCRTWQDEYPLEYETPADEPLKPQHVVERFDTVTPADTIVTAGVGQHQMWAWQHWTFTEPRTWVTSHGLGTMGYAVPAAIGAKLAAPDREVVAFDGDGSFLMTAQELTVAAREELDLTVVVLNNEAVGMVRQWQDGFYDGRRTASEYPWVPQFDAVAEAFGAKGLRAETYEGLEECIQTARAYDGPAVIDAAIDPEENVYPMVPGGGDNARFALDDDQLEGLQ